ncbi:MAG TPA: ribosome maturation factor RimM [Acidobacteriaceae bacterium]|nr:ribosome maturation factor RimM [Acidobacteriaceae bacterium]
MPSTNNWIRIAHLLRPQGRRGEVLAEILTDFPERFAQAPAAFLMRGERAEPQPITVESHWLHKGRIVLKFKGVDSISEAEALRGLDVVIPRDERVPLTDGAVYIDDLIGCALVDTNQPGGPVVGTVRDVEPQPEAVDLLVVAGADGREHLVPFAKAYLVRMDVAARRIEMAIPAGLLAVNAPLTPEEQATMGAEEELE